MEHGLFGVGQEAQDFDTIDLIRGFCQKLKSSLSALCVAGRKAALGPKARFRPERVVLN
jgi:hypothetical protein